MPTYAGFTRTIYYEKKSYIGSLEICNVVGRLSPRFRAHGRTLNRPSGLRIGLAAAAIAAAACLRLGGRLL